MPSPSPAETFALLNSALGVHLAAQLDRERLPALLWRLAEEAIDRAALADQTVVTGVEQLTRRAPRPQPPARPPGK